jgi:HK97 family phage major capsid protein
MATIAEQLASWEAKYAANAAVMKSLVDKSGETGESFDAQQQEEFDGILLDNEAIEGHLKRLHAMEKINLQTAQAVKASTSDQGSAARVPSQYRAPVQIKANHPKGTGFVRLIGAKWLSRNEFRNPADIAKERWGDTPEVEMVLRAGYDATNIADIMIGKTAVAAMNTTTSDAAAPLVVAQNLASEFFDVLRASTIVGRLPNLRRVPFNISVPKALTDPTGYWVGQNDIKPVSSMTFEQVTLGFNKVAGIVPITEELAKFSNPSAEGIIRDALVGALTYRTDRDFLDPDIAAVTGVKPASMTNGVTPTVASGTTAAAFRADLGDMIATYLGLNMSPAGLVLVMTSSQAMRLGLMRNSLGNKEFPDIGVMGGSIEGIPVLTSENIVATGGSPTDGYPIVALNSREILLADDGGVTIDVSREASLQMDTAPDSPLTTSTIQVSLWQQNLVAFKAERFITWKKGRTGAVQYISNAKYEES